jgi:hypothetical protein
VAVVLAILIPPAVASSRGAVVERGRSYETWTRQVAADQTSTTFDDEDLFRICRCRIHAAESAAESAAAEISLWDKESVDVDLPVVRTCWHKEDRFDECVQCSRIAKSDNIYSGTTEIYLSRH